MLEYTCLHIIVHNDHISQPVSNLQTFKDFPDQGEVMS